MCSPGDLHEEAALPEPPDVHAGLFARRMDLSDELLAGDGSVRSNPAAPRRTAVAARVARGAEEPIASGTGSASAARRLNAESRPRLVVGPEGKSASGSLAMAVRGLAEGSVGAGAIVATAVVFPAATNGTAVSLQGDRFLARRRREEPSRRARPGFGF